MGLSDQNQAGRDMEKMRGIDQDVNGAATSMICFF
jgi:hypothetical protein